MSPTPLVLPVLLAQTDYAAKIVHADKAKPEVERQLFGPLIQEQLRRNEGKVQQVDKKEAATPVDRDGQKNEQQAAPERERAEPEPEESQETGASNPSPWSGNIVNVKI